MEFEQRVVYVKDGDCTELNKFLEQGFIIDGYRRIYEDKDYWRYTVKREIEEG